MTVGIYSSAASRFVVNANVNGATGGPVGGIGSLQVLPGVDSSRILLFEFFDSDGVGWEFVLTLSDVAFETSDVFGGRKSAGDKADTGAY